MNKHTLLIIAGGIFLIGGLILSMGRKNEQVIYYVDSTLSLDEATSLIVEKTKNIMDIYENQNDIFIIDSSNDSSSKKDDEDTEEAVQEPVELYVKVTNYDEVVDDIFTKDGKTELESIEFNKNTFVSKEENDTYVLKEIPEDNKYSNCSISVGDVTILSDKISAKVSFTRDELDESNTLVYYVYEKDIEIIKDNDKWLVNSFNYPNV